MDTNIIAGKFALIDQHPYRQLSIHMNNFDIEHKEGAFLRDYVSPIHGDFMSNLVQYYTKETIVAFLQDMVLGKEGVA